jgi:uncharacterized phiE125 gp8 family phage protein
MALSVVTPPVGQLFDLEIAKKHLRLDADVEDDLLGTLFIPAVVERGETATRRAFLEQTWDLRLDAPPCGWWIEIPKPPLISVTFVKYIDTAGVEQTWGATNYTVSAPAGPRCRAGRLALAPGVSWPTCRQQIEAMTIRFVAGYGTEAEDVPAQLRVAALLDLGTLYEHREAIVETTALVELPDGAKAIYRRYKSSGRQVLAA